VVPLPYEVPYCCALMEPENKAKEKRETEVRCILTEASSRSNEWTWR
jgi:hypothetical protein